MALVHNEAPRSLTAYESLIDREFSEIGRNPHFAPGWFIVPGTLLTGLVAVTLLGWML